MNRLKAQNKTHTHLQWVDNTKLLACEGAMR